MSDLQDIEFEVNIEENLDEIIEEIELEISPIRDEDFQLTEETENTYFERFINENFKKFWLFYTIFLRFPYTNFRSSIHIWSK